MSTAMSFDEDMTRRVVDLYTTPDVVAQREATLEILDPQVGERVLDVGSGPGFLAAGIASRVGESGAVFGVDVSEPMIAHARGLEAAPGAATMTFGLGDATALGFHDQSFDAVVSTQVFEYVPDIGTALTEVHRVLVPGGRVLILDTDWDSLVWHTSDRERHGRVMSAWQEHLADAWLPRTLTRRLESAALAVERQDVLVLHNPSFDPRSFSAGVMQLIANFVPGRRGVTEEDASAWLADLQALGAGGEYFFSVNRYLFLARRI
ncbi:methyltransferase domain-containing protein [Angustibacter sp. McL0619]|uniref:methyltransferase domain-containing protein n=1 Tax=Angustibacter sp. McL0619 TaxID=3415676 RepID=UPI003CE843FC